MINMTELKSSFEKLGFKNVTSYINSGNLAFDSRSSESALGLRIEKSIKNDFGIDIQVMLRKQSTIADILANNPFDGEFESHKQMHVLFMKDEMPKERQKLLIEQNKPTEKFEVRGREIYALIKLGVADSLLGKGFIEKKLKVPITARNWRTVQKLAEL